jgi:ATP-dependent Clp protease ATP-binding subunit ClpA
MTIYFVGWLDSLYDQLVFRVEQAASEPLERVEAAAVLRTNAEADADRVMDRFVGQAREKGVSWTAIGDRLGVSKQAARQRYSDRVVDLQQQLQPRLQACLAQAQREAAADGRDQVQTEPLLVGLLAEGVAAAILVKLGLRPAAIRKAGHHFFGPPGAATSAKLGFSAEATSALETATRLARANRRDWRQTSVGTEHLLAALTFDPGSRARRALNELNKHAAADIKTRAGVLPGPERTRATAPPWKATTPRSVHLLWPDHYRGRAAGLRPGRVDLPGLCHHRHRDPGSTRRMN